MTRDLFGGRENREAGIEKVARGADTAWVDRALDALDRLSQRQAEFTAPDLWRFVERPREPRVLAIVIRRAVKLGWIEWTGRYTESPEPGQNARPVKVWRRSATRR